MHLVQDLGDDAYGDWSGRRHSITGPPAEFCGYRAKQSMRASVNLIRELQLMYPE